MKDRNTSLVRAPSPASDPVYARSDCNGRLGNQLNVLATLHAYEMDFGMVGLMPKSVIRVICHYFECRERIKALEELVPKWQSVSWDYFSPDDPKCRDVHNSSLPNRRFQYINIGVYPTGVQHFYRHLPELRKKFLTPRERFLTRARIKLEEARREYTKNHGVSLEVFANYLYSETLTFVGIHSRNDDYERHLGWYGLKLVGEEYFARAMNVFRQREKHTLFIITSDDMKWAREKILPSAKEDCFFLGSEKQNLTVLQQGDFIKVAEEIGNDLALLTLTNHTILTYGSFGMWGALLAEANSNISNRTVLMPEGYDNNSMNRNIRAANITGWRVI